jgi:hypothetical protein
MCLVRIRQEEEVVVPYRVVKRTLTGRSSVRERQSPKPHITHIEQKPGQSPKITAWSDLEFLNTSKTPQIRSQQPEHEKSLWIFIVEGATLEAIELLSARFGFDRQIFQDHTSYTGEDSNQDPRNAIPKFTATIKRRKWFQSWNVRLRPDVTNPPHKKSNGEQMVELQIERCLTTVWMGEDRNRHNAPTCVIMVDPMLEHRHLATRNNPTGQELRTFLRRSRSDIFESPGSFFSDVLGLTASYPWFEEANNGNPIDLGICALPALYSVCAEWLVLCDLIKVRLLELESSSGEVTLFEGKAPHIDRTFMRVNRWREQLPLWREMVNDTIEQTLPAAVRLTQRSDSTQSKETFEDLISDFTRVKLLLFEFQVRVDRLADRELAGMQLEAASQSVTESHNLARLTWLATIFIPLTFVSGLFSMNEDLATVISTFKIYFMVAIPLAVVSLLIARFGSSVVRYVMSPIIEQDVLRIGATWERFKKARRRKGLQADAAVEMV